MTRRSVPLWFLRGCGTLIEPSGSGSWFVGGRPVAGSPRGCWGVGNGAVTSPNPSRLTPSIEPLLARRRVGRPVGRRGGRWIRLRAAGGRGRSNAEACGHVEFDFAVREHVLPE